MKTTRIVVFIIIIYANLVVAQPTYKGTRGLLNTIAADNQGKSFLTLTFHANYFQENFSATIQNPNSYTLRNAKGFLSGAFALNEYFELSGGIGSILASDRRIYGDTSYTKFGFGDAYAGAKISFAPLWFLKLGGYGFYTFPTGSSVLKDKGYTLQKENFGGIGCITLDFLSPKSTIPFPFRFHINGGYLIDKNDPIDSLKDKNDLLLIRSGFEIPAGAFDLFADFSTEQAINNKDLKFSDNPMRITPGVRFYSTSSIFEIGAEIGLGKLGVEAIPGKSDKMSWKATFGVTFISRIVKPQTYADVTGTITDIDTKSPVMATVIALDEPKVAPVNADEHGKYKIRLSSGPHTLVFKADGYKELSKSIEIKDTLGIALDISLEPLVSFGYITGKVFDGKTGQPLYGTINFPGSSIEPVIIDKETGVYKAQLPVGTYTMELEIPGYYRLTEPVVVVRGETIQKDLAVKPVEKDEGTITGKLYNKNTGEPIGGTLVFPDKPEIQPIIANPATGIYEAVLPSGSYTVTIEVPGYMKKTDVVVVRKGELSKIDFPLTPIEKLVGGKLVGTVKDMNTGIPLEATITLAEGTVPPFNTNPETGAFEITIPEGSYTLKVTRAGYLPTTQTVIIKEKETTVQNITLKPVPMGTLTGKVVNTKDKSPLQANISFPGTDMMQVTADENGIYKTTLPPGTYTVRAEYPGFIAQAFPVIIEDGKTAVQNFELIKAGEKITLRGIYFDFNKATIKPESYPTLNEAVKILKDNPRIKVRIEGHTDSIGSDEYNLRLSQARADAVKAYLVKEGNIDPARIESVGKGEREPIASNDTEDGRALNRRIEFIVIGEQ